MVFVPAAALAFLVPKVPEVSSSPFWSFICDAKKLPTGLFGPERGASVGTV